MKKRDWFEGCRSVTLEEVLGSRDRRAAYQQRLLKEYDCALLSLKLNIPGEIKVYPLAEAAFDEGCLCIERQLAVSRTHVTCREMISDPAGKTAFWSVGIDASKAKKLMMAIENNHPLGRIFDIDVYSADGQAVGRISFGHDERICIICGGPVWACARSRMHTAEQIAYRTAEIIYNYISSKFADKIAGTAARAMLYEAAVTPKPGLVDRSNSGAHKDMNFFSFTDSTVALIPYFHDMTLRGIEYSGDISEMLNEFRHLGQEAEDLMLAVTGGVNTQKGLIFSMGIFCAGIGYLYGCSEEITSDAVLDICGEIACGVEIGPKTIPTTNDSHGEEAFALYGLTGVRGEAAAGYPNVRIHGYPVLKKLVDQGLSLNDAGVITLLHLIAHVDDTNIAHRADNAVLQDLKQDVRNLLQSGASFDSLLLASREMDQSLIDRGISPGGSADLLALTFMLFFLSEMMPDK